MHRTLRMGSIAAVLLLAARPPSAAAEDGVHVLKDVDYVEDQDYAEGKDRLDLYLPEGAADFPVVVFFHGGGLRAGDKSGSEHVGRALASQGVGAAIANYRLSPSVSHPFHAEDAARSVSWVYRNVKAHGGDPYKLYLSGHSAGAYLVALLATDHRYLETQELSTDVIKGVVPISGFFWVERVAPDRPKDVWGQDEKLWPEASPAKFVGANVPPMLFLYADGDEPWRRQQNEEMAAALKGKGHEKVETSEIADRDHLGIFQKLAPGDPAFERLVAFVKR